MSVSPEPTPPFTVSEPAASVRAACPSPVPVLPNLTAEAAKKSAAPGSPGTSVLDLRLSQDFAAAAFGKAVLVDVSVGKPPRAYFWQARPVEGWSTILYTLDASTLGAEGTYAVGPAVVSLIPDQVRLVHVRSVVTSQGVPYLVPVPLAAPDGRLNPWHRSLARAVEMAETRWIRISANQARGGYDVFEAQGQLPDPQWPSETFEELLEIGFRDRLILDAGHPLVQQLLGA